MTPPETDEIEVTVIGPGFGESILIHVGMQEWFIVDSCLDSTSGRPAALPYLEGMNVDPARHVKGILATHWHDDHIGGMSQLLSACGEAQFTCAPALTKKEFVDVATLYNKNRIALGSTGLTEIQQVLRLLRQRRISPQYA